MTKGCYTCRRRRVVCDNGLPTCRKCRDAGKECLGYQKPLVWVKGGVASRGKMMGLRFEDVMESPKGHSGEDQPSMAESSSPPRSQEQDFGLASADMAHTQIGLGNIEFQIVGPHTQGSLITPSQLLRGSQAASHAADDNEDRSIVHFPARVPDPNHIPTPWGLVDPLFQDMDWLSRLYISHFNQRCVRDLALYDNVKNPYRELIPLVGDSPILSDALAAIGAVHCASISNGGTSPISMASSMPVISSPSFPSQDTESTSTTALSRRPASEAYEHFLRFKQRALRQLSLDLLDPVRRNDDRTVAGILVLILLDAMESGSGAWKFHLEGAKNLLKSRESGSDDSNMRKIIEGLDTFVIDSCLIIEIMGSTLARPGALSKPFYSHRMGPGILKRLEQTSWVGCPAYLLEVIFFVHAERYSDTDLYDAESSALSHLSSPESLLQHIKDFNPSSWAEEMQTFLFLPDLSGRIALASAYKAAVYLYASRVLSKSKPNSSTVPVSARYDRAMDHANAVDELIYQLSLIDPSDSHFKCLIWPTFIAGAESKYASQRAFALDRLGALWTAISSINVRNAAWVLGLMWQRQDERRHDRERKRAQSADTDGSVSLDYDDHDDDEGEFNWIQELDNSRADWLFI